MAREREPTDASDSLSRSLPALPQKYVYSICYVMCMYMYMYMYMCMYMYVYVYMYMYLYMYVCACVCFYSSLPEYSNLVS